MNRGPCVNSLCGQCTNGFFSVNYVSGDEPCTAPCTDIYSTVLLLSNVPKATALGDVNPIGIQLRYPDGTADGKSCAEIYPTLPAAQKWTTATVELTYRDTAAASKTSLSADTPRSLSMSSDNFTYTPIKMAGSVNLIIGEKFSLRFSVFSPSGIINATTATFFVYPRVRWTRQPAGGPNSWDYTMKDWTVQPQVTFYDDQDNVISRDLNGLRASPMLDPTVPNFPNSATLRSSSNVLGQSVLDGIITFRLLFTATAFYGYRLTVKELYDNTGVIVPSDVFNIRREFDIRFTLQPTPFVYAGNTFPVAISQFEFPNTPLTLVNGQTWNMAIRLVHVSVTDPLPGANPVLQCLTYPQFNYNITGVSSTPGSWNFDDLRIIRTGIYRIEGTMIPWGYQVNSTDFEILPASINKLIYYREPGNDAVIPSYTNLRINPQPIVALKDEYENTCGDDATTASVYRMNMYLDQNSATLEDTVMNANPPTNIHLAGNMTLPFTKGVITFTDLIVLLRGTAYSLIAYAYPTVGNNPSFTLRSNDFTVSSLVIGPPTRLNFFTQPGPTGFATETLGKSELTISQAPRIAVWDSRGVPFSPPTYNFQITLTLVNNPGGATVSGALTKSVDDANEKAIFDDISLNKKGVGYVFRATLNSLDTPLTLNSEPFTIYALDQIYSVEFEPIPLQGQLGRLQGVPIATNIADAPVGYVRIPFNPVGVAKLKDIAGNVIDYDNNTVIHVDLTTPTPSSKAIFTAFTSYTVSQGVMSFPSWSLDQPGFPYMINLTALCTNVLPDVSTLSRYKTPQFVTCNPTLGQPKTATPQFGVLIHGRPAKVIWKYSPRGPYDNGTMQTLEPLQSTSRPLMVYITDENDLPITTVDLEVSLSLVTLSRYSGPYNKLIPLGKISGTTTKKMNGKSDAGYVTFDDLSVDKNGTFQINATVTGKWDILSSPYTIQVWGASAPFTVSMGKVDRIQFLVQPSSSISGMLLPTQPVVAYLDVGGNIVIDHPTTYRVSYYQVEYIDNIGYDRGRIDAAPLDFGLAVYDFNFPRKGTFAISARPVGFPLAIQNTESAQFNISEGIFSQIMFQQNPVCLSVENLLTPNCGYDVAARVWTSQPVVFLSDLGGFDVLIPPYPVTCTVNLNFSTANYFRDPYVSVQKVPVLSGTKTVAMNSSGFFTWTDLSIDKVGNGYVLVFTCSANSSVIRTSYLFDIVVGPAKYLQFEQSPPISNTSTSVVKAEVNLVTGAAPIVTLRDAGNNIVSTDNSTAVALSILADLTRADSNPVCRIAGDTNITADGGIADWRTRKTRIDKVGTYRLRAVAYIETTNDPFYPLVQDPFPYALRVVAGLSTTFVVVNSDPTHLIFYTQPGNSTGGKTLAIQPKIAIRDAGENIITIDSSSQINLFYTSTYNLTNTNTPVRTLVRVVNGIASFTGVAFNEARNENYLLATNVLSRNSETIRVLSDNFVVRIGDIASLRFEAMPTVPQIANYSFTSNVLVSIRDSGGNLVPVGTPGYETLVAVSLYISTNPLPTRLPRTRLKQNVTDPFTGDVVTLVEPSVIINTTREGYSNFSRLFIDWIGLGYRLTAQLVDPLNSTNTFAPFDIPKKEHTVSLNLTLGVPYSTDFIAGPNGATAGQLLSIVPVAALRDIAEDVIFDAPSRYRAQLVLMEQVCVENITFVANATSNITCYFDLSNVSITTMDYVALSVGFASWPNVRIPKKGVYRFRVIMQTTNIAYLSASELRQYFSGNRTMPSGYFMRDAPNSFRVLPGEPAILNIEVHPSGGRAAELFPIQPVVTIQDIFRNVIDSDSSTTVDVRISTNVNGATLFGTKRLPMINGTVKFTDLRMNRVGSGYRLQFQFTSVLHPIYRNYTILFATSNTFSIVYGPPAYGVINQHPSGAPKKVIWSIQPKMSIYDAGDNLLTIENNGTLTATIKDFIYQIPPAPVYTKPNLTATELVRCQNITTYNATICGVRAIYENYTYVYPGPMPQLRGNTTVRFQNGSAVFTDLNIDVIADYTLNLTYNGTVYESDLLPIVPCCNGSFVKPNTSSEKLVIMSYSYTTRQFTVLPPVPTRLFFNVQPSGGRSTQPWVRYPEVHLLDQVGDVIETDNSSVVSITLNELPAQAFTWPVPIGYRRTRKPPTPPYRAPIMNGTFVTNMSSGKAFFPSLTINKVGNYSLLTSIVTKKGEYFKDYKLVLNSSRFEISLGPAVRMAFAEYITLGGPENTVWPPEGQPIVQLYDAGDNVVTTEYDTNCTIVFSSKMNGSEILAYIVSVNPWLTRADQIAREDGTPTPMPYILPNITSKFTGTNFTQFYAGRAIYFDHSIDFPGNKYAFYAFTSRRYFSGQANEITGIPSLDVIGRELPAFNATSPQFTVSTAEVEEPPRIEVSGSYADFLLSMTWISCTLGGSMIVGGSIALSSQLVFLSKASPTVLNSLAYHAMAFLNFFQLWNLMFEHNFSLKRVFFVIEPQRVFQGNIDKGSDPTTDFAHSLVTKILTAMILLFMWRITRGFFIQSCIGSFNIHFNFWLPFFLSMYLPLAESLFDVDRKNPIFTGCLWAGLMIISFCWVLHVVFAFREQKKIYEKFLPDGRGWAGFTYRPEKESLDREYRSNPTIAFSDISIQVVSSTTKKVEVQEEEQKEEEVTGTAAAAKLFNRNANTDADKAAPIKKKKSALKLNAFSKAKFRESQPVPPPAKLRFFEELMVSFSRFQWKCSCYNPSSKYLAALKRRKEEAVRRENMKQANLGNMRNPEFDNFEMEKEIWEKFQYRHLFEPVVMYRRTEDQKREMNAFEAILYFFREHLAHYWIPIKFLFLLTYCAAALSFDYELQIFLCMFNQLLYMACLLLLAPLRSPYLQKEVILTGALIVMLGLVLGMVQNPLYLWALGFALVVQIVAIPLCMFCIYAFKEPPMPEPKEYIPNKNKKGKAEELGLVPKDYSHNLPRSKSVQMLEKAGDEQDAEYFTRIAKLYWQMGGEYITDRRYAYAYFAMAAKTDKKNAEALAYLGEFYRTVEHDETKSVKFFRKALRLDPCNEIAGSGMADHYISQNKYEKVSHIYDKAISSNRDRADWAIHRRKEEFASGVALRRSTSEIAVELLKLRQSNPTDISDEGQPSISGSRPLAQSATNMSMASDFSTTQTMEDFSKYASGPATGSRPRVRIADEDEKEPEGPSANKGNKQTRMKRATSKSRLTRTGPSSSSSQISLVTNKLPGDVVVTVKKKK